MEFDLGSSLKKSVGLRQANQAALLQDLTSGLKLEREKERALHKYHGLPVESPANGEDDMIHVGDVTINNSPSAATQGSKAAGLQTSATTSRVYDPVHGDAIHGAIPGVIKKAAGLASFAAPILVSAGVIGGGGLAGIVAFKLAEKFWAGPPVVTQPPDKTLPPAPKPPPSIWRDYNLEAIDDEP